jgi:hypothetical protein
MVKFTKRAAKSSEIILKAIETMNELSALSTYMEI